MSALLWVLVAVGAWNGINALARIYYRAPISPYLYHIFCGIYAAAILWSTK